MYSHYYKYLKLKGVSSKNLSVLRKIDRQGFGNIKEFTVDNITETKILYTSVELKSTINTSIKTLHVILPGIDLGGTSHLFTAWDILYEQYFLSLSKASNVSFLLISPFTSTGNVVSEKLLHKLKAGGEEFITKTYCKWIEEFIEKEGQKYSEIILHGMSAGASYAYIIGKRLKQTRSEKILIIMDNPTLLINRNFCKLVQIPLMFMIEGLSRRFIDKKVRIPAKYEGNIRRILQKRLGRNILDKKIMRATAFELIKILFKISIISSQKVPGCEFNISKFDFTLLPIRRGELKKYGKVNILNGTHFINRLGRIR